MGRISTRIELDKLEHKIITTKKGTKCIVIPLDVNNIYHDENGRVNIDLIGFDFNNTRKNQDGTPAKETHIIKQSFPKDKLDAMTDEEKKALPILGNHVDWSMHGGGRAGQESDSLGEEISEGFVEESSGQDELTY